MDYKLSHGFNLEKSGTLREDIAHLGAVVSCKICLLWPHVPDKEVCSLGRKRSRENSGKSNQNLRCVRRYTKLDAVTYFSEIKKRKTQK
ncbi:unnamed protein product [Porites evermanni]|uniref:Uncharacterized protein n=1 Tax=Porites evermanni TaxID=104178 RepID=A0ABN8SG99_9CNID|nr:unnamed protein product [Porites evermanni]